MTIESIKSRIQVNGGVENLVGFLFNNGGAWYIWGDTTKFNPDTDLVIDSESELIICRGFFPTNKNMIKSFTIPKIVEKEVFTIEAMIFATSREDVSKIERSDSIMY